MERSIRVSVASTVALYVVLAAGTAHAELVPAYEGLRDDVIAAGVGGAVVLLVLFRKKIRAWIAWIAKRNEP